MPFLQGEGVRRCGARHNHPQPLLASWQTSPLLCPRRYAQLLLDVLPSGVAFAVGMYVSPKFTLPRVFGMLAEQAWLRVNPETHTNLMLVTASGLVLGEGTASVFLALTKAA